MAAAILRAHAAKAGDADAYLIESAGTWGVDGQPAAEFSQRVMQEHGLALDGHVARTVDETMMREADLILVMTRSHRDALAAEFPWARPKVHLMSELNQLEYDITDPYGKPLENYRTCASDLQNLIERGYPRLADWLATTPDRARNV
jgi:protein-tyrosine-phosphatase